MINAACAGCAAVVPAPVRTGPLVFLTSQHPPPGPHPVKVMQTRASYIGNTAPIRQCPGSMASESPEPAGVSRALPTCLHECFRSYPTFIHNSLDQKFSVFNHFLPVPCTQPFITQICLWKAFSPSIHAHGQTPHT